MRERIAALLGGVLVVGGAFALSAQGRTADQGVYTAAQAGRGAKVWDTQCATCHREAGGNAPLIVGDRFTRSFADATLSNLFTTIKTTMPRNAPASLSDADYADVVTHLLRLNGYPDGMNELAVADMASIRIPGQGGNLDQALVLVVGCLSRDGRNWTLSTATEPVRTREPEAPQGDEAAKLDASAPGTRSFRLQQVYSAPAGWTNQKVAAKGFLSRSGTEERVTVTSLQTLQSTCQN